MFPFYLFYRLCYNSIVKKTLIEEIQDKYEPLKLFFPADITVKGMTDEAVKTELHRLAEKGAIERYAYGLYYLPGKRGEEPSAIDAITIRYLQDGDDVYGFYTGDNFIKTILGNPVTIDDHLEIMTNRATSGKKNVFMFGKRFILRKPYVPIKRDNVALNAFLSYIAMTELKTIKANYSLLSNFIKKEHLSALEVMKSTDYYPSKTMSKLLASDLYRSLWRH